MKQQTKKRNFQSVQPKQKGFIRRTLPILLIVIFAIMGMVLIEMVMEGDTYKPGKITGTHYESEMMDISFDAPEGFQMSTQKQIDKQLKESVSFANRTKGASARRMEMAAISQNGTSISVITWDMGKDDMTAREYANVSKETILTQYEGKVKFVGEGEVKTTVVADEDYERLTMKFESEEDENVVRCSESYVRMVDGYAVLIGIAYNEDQVAERDALLAAIKPF